MKTMIVTLAAFLFFACGPNADQLRRDAATRRADSLENLASSTRRDAARAADSLDLLQIKRSAFDTVANQKRRIAALNVEAARLDVEAARARAEAIR